MPVRGRPSTDVSGCAGAFEREVVFVRRSLRRHGVRQADLDDLTQEVLIVMWRRWSDYDPQRPLRPWLAGITFKVAYGHRRRSRRDFARSLDQAEPAPSLEEQVESRRQRALALRALGALSDRHRAVLVLHDMDGLTMDEVGRILEVPRSTAFSRLRVARGHFAKAVRRLEVAERAAGRAVPDAATLLAIERGTPEPSLEHAGQSTERTRRILLSVPPESPEIRIPARLRPWQIGAPLFLAAGALLVFGLRPAPVTVAATRTPTSSLARGLVGHWRFDDAQGGRAMDHSGQGNHCLLRGRQPAAAWGPGRTGGALRLERDGWLECAPSPSLAGPSTELTVAAWVRLSGRRGVHTLLARQQASDPRDDFFFGIFTRTPEVDELVVNSRTWSTRVDAPLVGGRGRWIHVAATEARSGATTLFVDGQAVATRWATHPQERLQAVKALLIGGGANGTEPHAVNQLFDGELDELLLYERALGTDEIAALASNRSP
jgi:RNA polymerase sigma-70 factor (ECF subfamily)